MNRSTEHTTRANRLLLAALKTPEKLPELSLTDWDVLIRTARRVRLLGRLEADLARLGLLEQIPPRAADHLRATRNVIEHRGTLIKWEANRLLWALKDYHGPLVLLKGAAYVLADLPPSRGRLFADVDLLAPEDRVVEIEEKLAAKGWLKLPIDPYDDRYYRVWMHEIPPLRHRERGTEIDIHHRILPKTSRVKSDPSLLFASIQPLQEPRLAVLAPSDMVLHALVHLLMEGDPTEGLRLRDLHDVHELLGYFGREADFWPTLVDRARLLNLERSLFYGLRYARALFDSKIPPEIIEQLKRAAPSLPVLALMDVLVPLALFPGHPDYPILRAAIARWLLYARAHWLRMPFLLLIRHLSYKAYLRLRGVGKKVDLAQLDLRQQ